jgi:predicted O-methyltransferase YrrM
MSDCDEALELAALICDQMQHEQIEMWQRFADEHKLEHAGCSAYGTFCLITAAARIREAKGYAEMGCAGGA